jgi:hypothetical protein
MLTSAHLQQATDVIEIIVKINSQDDLEKTVKTILKEAVDNIDPEDKHPEDKRKIYSFMSSLFLNVMINRLNELGENAKKNAIIARQIISKLVQEEGELKHV